MLDAATATSALTQLTGAVTEQAPFIITIMVGVTALVWGARLTNNAIRKGKVKF